MPEEVTPEETPEAIEAAPDEGTPAPVETEPPIDWEKRANDNQTAYTQSQQELAEYRQQMEQLQDPEYKRQVFNEWADEFGYALPDQEEEYVDPGELALQEAQAIRQELAEAKEAQEEDSFWQEKSEGFIEQLDKFQAENFKLTDAEVKAAGAQVLLAGVDPDEVFQDLQAIRQAGYEHIVASKKAPRISGGQAGTPKFDPSNEEEVDAALLAEVEAAMADSDE
jgi:hypothetical protein